MSEANVQRVRDLVDAWNRRDLDAMLSLAHEDAEFVNAPTAIEPGTRRGAAELTAVFSAQWEMLLDGRQDIDHIYDRGDEVVVLGRLSQRVPGSDSRIEDRFLTSYRFRDGRITRAAVLAAGTRDVRRALESAGLAPA